jgi:hypothetical protein
MACNLHPQFSRHPYKDNIIRSTCVKSGNTGLGVYPADTQCHFLKKNVSGSMDFGRVIHFLYYWKDPILDAPSVNVVLLVMGWQSTINISEFIEITQQVHSVVIMLKEY